MKKFSKVLSVVVSFIIIFSAYTLNVNAEEKSGVSISKSKLLVKIGQTKKLKIKNFDGQAGQIEWKSSKNAIAKVDEFGAVTGCKAGKAVVSAKVGDDIYKCKVTIIEKPELVGKHYMCIGTKDKLVVTGTNKKVKWYSANKKIVKVNKKGVIKAIKKGNAKILAKVGKKTLKCRVLVKKAISKLGYTLDVGNVGYMQVGYMAKEIYAEVTDPSIVRLIATPLGWDDEDCTYSFEIIVYGRKSGTTEIVFTNNVNKQKEKIKVVVKKPEDTTAEQKLIDYIIENGQVTDVGDLAITKSAKDDISGDEALGVVEFNAFDENLYYYTYIKIAENLTRWDLFETENENDDRYITMDIDLLNDDTDESFFVTNVINAKKYAGEELVFNNAWFGVPAANELQPIANEVNKKSIDLLSKLLVENGGFSWSDLGYTSFVK